MQLPTTINQIQPRAEALTQCADDTLLNEQALSQRWQISVRTLQNQRVQGGGIPFLKIGRAVRYRMSDILAFEAAARRINTSEGKSHA